MRPRPSPRAVPGALSLTVAAVAAGQLLLAAGPAAAAIPARPYLAGQAAAACSAKARSAIGAAQADIDAIAAGPGCTVLAAGTMNLSRSVLFSWTGSGWRRVASVAANSTNLSAIAAPATGSTWAVGYTSHGVADQTLILRKTGASWAAVKTPDPAGTAGLNDLYGVAAAGPGAWAVGSRSVSATAYGVLILGWNGTRWVVARVPKVAGARDSVLFSAAAISSSSAWAVGTEVAGSTARPLIERFQHGHWAIVGSPTQSGELESVTVVSARNAWAVGYRTAGGTTKTLVEHWNGTKWSVVASPNVAKAGGQTAANQLRGVAARSARNVDAVGVAQAPDGTELTLLLHWNGHAWTRIASPDPAGSGGVNELQGVAARGAAGFWIAGSYRSGGVLHSFALHRS
jgi:hypothetical protein